MTLVAGSKVGPYEILSHLGAGGQGEVYKARDVRLNRLVAIKVLPDSLSQNPKLKVRFEREAQTLGSLSHPHICPVFDVGRHDEIDYLVMEFIEGGTLAERLKAKQLPLDHVLRIAIEVADALDKAHRQGIAHRDVKPSNIMLTKTLDKSEKPKRFFETSSNEFRAQISPDGHWIAYVSNESGSDEVMVESFPQPGQRKRISPDGGTFPEWRPDGRELYYLAPSAGQRRKLMAVKVEAGSTFSASRPEFLFEAPEMGNNPRRAQYAVFGNGDRFS